MNKEEERKPCVLLPAEIWAMILEHVGISTSMQRPCLYRCCYEYLSRPDDGDGKEKWSMDTNDYLVRCFTMEQAHDLCVKRYGNCYRVLAIYQATKSTTVWSLDEAKNKNPKFYDDSLFDPQY